MNRGARSASGALHQGIDLWGTVAVGLGTAFGVSIFAVFAPAARVAGAGMLVSIALASLPMLVFSLIYAFMSSAAPTSGATYTWPRRFIHPALGFAIAWLDIAGNTSLMIVLALVLVRYVDMLVPLPPKAAMFGLFALVYATNLFGVSIAARVQKALVGALVAFFLAFALWGLSAAHAENFRPLLAHGWTGVLAAVPLLIPLFLGIEAAAEVGDEVRDVRRTLPLGIGVAIASALALYLLIGATLLGALGPTTLAASSAPLLDAAQRFAGAWARPLIVLVALASIGKSLNAIFMSFSRNLYAMARERALPAALAAVHPRWGTPHVACTLVFGLCTAGLLLPMSVTFLFLAVGFITLLKYSSTALSAAIVVRRHRELYAAARFRPAPAVMLTLVSLGLVSVVLILLLGARADWRPYAAAAIWALLGAGYYVVRLRLL
jgi:basic amino acid/polyamine antiporter, APA family